MSEPLTISQIISRGDTQEAIQLITENPKLINKVDEDGRTPLHWACSMANTTLVDCILKYDVDIDEQLDEGGWTPFHIAAAVGSLEIIEKLLAKGVDIDVETSTGVTALQYAVSKNNIEVVKYLIDHKASCRIKDKRGWTVLHRAASIGSSQIIKLVANKTSLNAKDNNGWTAMHHALAEGHGEAAVLLVKLGADPTIVDDEGKEPVQVSVDENVANYFRKEVTSDAKIAQEYSKK